MTDNKNDNHPILVIKCKRCGKLEYFHYYITEGGRDLYTSDHDCKLRRRFIL